MQQISFSSSISDLSTIPEKPGIYFVKKGKEKPTLRIREDLKGHREAIEKKYNTIGESEVLYIGKATNLRTRITEFILHGYDIMHRHSGGQYIFALGEWQSFKIEYTECNDCEDEEYRKIEEFKKTHNDTLPFANLKGGRKPVK